MCLLDYILSNFYQIRNRHYETRPGKVFEIFIEDICYICIANSIHKNVIYISAFKGLVIKSLDNEIFYHILY